MRQRADGRGDEEADFPLPSALCPAGRFRARPNPMSHGRLLVVEDDDHVRSLLVEYFREHSDVEVDTARDGVEALHAISSHDYAVVVLDLMMPRMSGIDFLDSLQALSSDPSLKTLAAPP